MSPSNMVSNIYERILAFKYVHFVHHYSSNPKEPSPVYNLHNTVFSVVHSDWHNIYAFFVQFQNELDFESELKTDIHNAA